MAARAQHVLAGLLGLSTVAGGAVVAHADHPYHGVSPDSAHVPEHLPAPPGSPVVTWPGFQMLPDGRSMVFVQTGQEPQLTRKNKGSDLWVLLEGLSLPPGNARRPLDTRFFNTPVRSVRLKKHPRGVVLIVDMRTATEPTVETKRSESGYYFVKLTFPAGEYR